LGRGFNKAVAATGSSAFGAALSTIVLYFVELSAILPPESVKAAITTILTALATLGAAYFTPLGSGETVVRTTDEAVNTARTT
jgi:putative exporter of polyketide antibiotics